ncbi:hypothetical protein [Treponema sp. R80B11-R83G3]
MNKKIIMIFIFLICIGNIHAQDAEVTNEKNIEKPNTQNTETSKDHGIEITNMETEYFLISDFNRTFNFVGGFSATGKIEFNERVAVKEGIYINYLPEDVTIIKLFTNATYRILADLPLDVKLAWVYNGLPDYETHSHAIVPIISWDAKYYGISVGFGWRFTSFFDEGPQLEYMMPMGLYVNFINNDKLCVGMSLANYNDFQIDSFIAFALAAKVTIKLDNTFSISNELEFRQSGVDGLTATPHGVVWKGGAKLTW